MTDETMPDWVLIEAAKRCGWDWDIIDVLHEEFDANPIFRALCDMILKHEQPPVDRKVLCAREAIRELGADPSVAHNLGVRAIELYEEGFGQ